MIDIDTVMDSIRGRMKHLKQHLDENDPEELLSELLSITGYLAGTLEHKDAGAFIDEMVEKVMNDDWDDDDAPGVNFH